MPTSRRPGQHRDPVAPVTIPADRVPEPGPIAVYPTASDWMVDAVRAGGGTVAELSDATRGLVWLAGPPADLPAVLDAHPGIGWVQLPLAGVENYAAALTQHPGIVWTSAKGAYAEPVAEHALTLTLGLLRQLPEKSQARTWPRVKTGKSLYGCEVVIVGAGGIAIELLRLLAPFEVSVTIVRRSDAPLEGADRTVSSEHLLEVLPTADVVILAAAATDETTQIIGERELAAMRTDAVLVNIARGRLIDQSALVAALEAGHLWGAGLDVTVPEPLPDGDPLWSAPRTVLTFHSADTDEMVAPLLADRTTANTRAFLGGGGFTGLVDARAGY